MSQSQSADGTQRARALRRLFWWIALPALALVLARTFLFDVFYVESGSMEPTLAGPGADGAGGDAVLVLYDVLGRGGDLARFDLVVVQRDGGRRQAVKRVVGLPGESVQIVEGDVVIEGERLSAEVARPAPILLFDDRLHPLAELFSFDAELWRNEADGWHLDARAIAPRSDAGLLLYHKELDDGWVDSSGARRPGRLQVNDGVVECEARVDEPGGRLRLKLVEEGDSFEASIAPLADGRARLELLRWNQDTLLRRSDEERVECLAGVEVPFALGSWHELRFANVDDALALELDGRPILFAAYPGNEPRAQSSPGGQRSSSPRVALGGEQLSARFRGIRVLRDRYYVPLGEHGVAAAFPLGPSEYFVLGDNSADSRDSRSFGAIAAQDVIGRPIAVVWPPGRCRVLERAGRR